MIIDIHEFEFKDKQYFVTKDPLVGKERKMWSEITLQSPSSMKINCKDLGDKRWSCRAEVPSDLARDFEAWIKETMRDRCLLKKIFEYEPDGALKRIYEIRGGDIADRTLLVLRWK